MATWLLVANASCARLYETQPRPRTLTLVKSFEHPASRDKGEDLASDRPGHIQTDNPGGEAAAHSAFNEPTSPKEYEHERFAMMLAKELEDGRTHNRFDQLILVASPQFHGLLNKQMNGHLTKMVSKHLSKDYTRLDEAGLVQKLDPLA